jgi:hypothetical protein
MRALAVLALFASILPAAAQRELRTEERVRLVARALYRALARSDAGKLAVLVSSDADLRIGTRLVATGPDAILAALRTRPVWSELSPPWLEGISVRLLSTDTAAVAHARVL